MLRNLLRYILRQCFISLFRNLGLALASMSIIAVSLILLGAFLLVAVNTGEMIRGLESSVEIGVFLEEGANRELLEEKLDQLEGVKSYLYISRHQGLEELSRELGEEDIFKEMEGEHNPLPDAFRVTSTEAEMVPLVAEQIRDFPGVEKAEYGGEILSWMQRLGHWINILTLGMGALLAAAAVYLIVTTIRLSLLSRREEVSIMKYLGAGNWFIRFPFLLEGMIIGWVGTVLSVAVLAAGYNYLASYLSDLELVFFWRPVTDSETLFPIWAGLLLLGTLIGGLGSLLALRRFLKV